MRVLGTVARADRHTMIGSITMIGDSKEPRLTPFEVDMLFQACLQICEMGTQAKPAQPIWWSREPMALNHGKWTN